MRWKNDASGGYLLKKVADGKTYILMSSVKDSFKKSASIAPNTSSLLISGQAISAEDQDIVTGDGTKPDYIITNLSDISG